MQLKRSCFISFALNPFMLAFRKGREGGGGKERDGEEKRKEGRKYMCLRENML